jgi:SAM-dependent methyltransferase
MRLNLGCGREIREGWTNLDRQNLPGVDCVFDLEGCGLQPLPFDDDCFEAIEASHLLEHIRNLLPLAQELHRVAVPGTVLTVRCPYGSSDDAWEDPEHVRAFFLNSFGYLSQPFYWRVAEPGFNTYRYYGDWQPRRITLICRPENKGLGSQDLLAKINRERNVVQEMIVELLAVKPPRPPNRDLQTAPELRLGA